MPCHKTFSQSFAHSVALRKKALLTMPDVECTISGLDDLEQKLTDLLPKQAKRAMMNASDAGISILILAIEAADPVKNGFLRDHEVRSTKATGGGTIVSKVGPEAKVGYFTLSETGKGKLQAKQSAHYPSLYAMWYEFGTKHQPARPVMGPALESNQGAIINAFIAELNAQLGKFS